MNLRFPCGLETNRHFSIKKLLQDPSIGHAVMVRPAEEMELWQDVKTGDLLIVKVVDIIS